MSFRRKKYFIRSGFTLIELIVALVIMSLLAALAVSSLREESPASALNQQMLTLDAWCAAIRYACAENGVDYSVRFVPEKKVFYACKVDPDAEVSEDAVEVIPESGPMRLAFSERMEVSTVERAEEEARETEYVEIFRFYPNGGAACINRPVVKCENLAKYADVSFLSGQLRFFDGDGSDLEQEREREAE
jgi:prepilin-type N-terminal cleavage/methylation domain-containing protein